VHSGASEVLSFTNRRRFRTSAEDEDAFPLHDIARASRILEQTSENKCVVATRPAWIILALIGHRVDPKEAMNLSLKGSVSIECGWQYCVISLS
jgi:hypothetical protein